MADYNNPQQGSVAPEKKSLPVKFIAVAAACLAVVILLVVILSSGLSDDVKNEIEGSFNYSREVKVGNLKKEFKVSKDGASYYVISGRIKGSTVDEDDDDYPEEYLEMYEDGYFYGEAIEYDGEVIYHTISVYETDDKDDFKDDLNELIEEGKYDKEEIVEILESIVEAIEFDGAELDETIIGFGW